MLASYGKLVALGFLILQTGLRARDNTHSGCSRSSCPGVMQGLRTTNLQRTCFSFAATEWLDVVYTFSKKSAAMRCEFYQQTMLRLFIPVHVCLTTSYRLDVLSRTWAGIENCNKQCICEQQCGPHNAHQMIWQSPHYSTTSLSPHTSSASQTCSFAKWCPMLHEKVAFEAPCFSTHCGIKSVLTVFCTPPWICAEKRFCLNILLVVRYHCILVIVL